jgi:diaminohydroxyphosphoribosylaminopyrimidine deaminase/5-amino-6-(5-phosphoribosylamino)uracil reductase
MPLGGPLPLTVVAINCVETLKVVLSVLDPDIKVAGQGVKAIQDAGIPVTTGVCSAEGRAALKEYLHHRSTGRPYTVLKAALSLDGKIACADNTSQWITGEEARADGHLLRARSQAILIGSGTALADSPKLTTRVAAELMDERGQIAPASPSLRVVLDSAGKVVTGPLMDTALAPTLIFTTAAAPEASLAVWKAAGVDVCVVPANPAAADRVCGDGAAAAGEGVGTSAGARGLSLTAVLYELGSRGILQLLVEGGAAVHSQFLKHNLVDEIHMYKGATVLGSSAKPWVAGELAGTIADAKFWHLRTTRVLGNDVCMEYEVRGSKL